MIENKSGKEDYSEFGIRLIKAQAYWRLSCLFRGRLQGESITVGKLLTQARDLAGACFCVWGLCENRAADLLNAIIAGKQRRGKAGSPENVVALESLETRRLRKIVHVVSDSAANVAAQLQA